MKPKEIISLFLYRLVMTEVEVEVYLERDAEEGEEGEEPTPIITVEQEEEVVLFWSEGAERKYKSILELAESAKYNEDDNHILQYYR